MHQCYWVSRVALLLVIYRYLSTNSRSRLVNCIFNWVELSMGKIYTLQKNGNVIQFLFVTKLIFFTLKVFPLSIGGWNLTGAVLSTGTNDHWEHRSRIPYSIPFDCWAKPRKLIIHSDWKKIKMQGLKEVICITQTKEFVANPVWFCIEVFCPLCYIYGPFYSNSSQFFDILWILSDCLQWK